MQGQSAPIIVNIVEENEISGLGSVLVQAVGLTGAMAFGALVLGLVLASIIIGYRKMRLRTQSDEEAVQTQSLGLTPSGRD